ncbi:MBL fold metallo-hydrolase [Geobacter pelophilus]|uniref:MBL fold metallo-hydrolase n=1 Tax=Geoanaerobacter pelophilus TaxID=60036 RepID=A0AAW4KXR7_9BACT|nr:MBL fold metallo-hydrolase [Geoanaerobacter pelophilus]MBT0662672.1 MBL fold metallo-hydrolase [Geoanaerobacter pelophilus]
MKVISLRGSPDIYSCRAYLVLGDWNRIEDVNTLIDVGTDGSIIGEIEAISTGIGKRAVEQVIITHNHFDHVGGIDAIIKRFKPHIFSYGDLGRGESRLRGWETLRMGDRDCQVFHTPGHSSDSICLYSPEEKALFPGDTPLRILTPGGTYSREFLSCLQKLASLNIQSVYPGHDDPILTDAHSMILHTLSVVRKSQISP